MFDVKLRFDVLWIYYKKSFSPSLDRLNDQSTLAAVQKLRKRQFRSFLTPPPVLNIKSGTIPHPRDPTSVSYSQVANRRRGGRLLIFRNFSDPLPPRSLLGPPAY